MSHDTKDQFYKELAQAFSLCWSTYS